jgi:LPXTG-motif cell wall-anchored protein
VLWERGVVPAPGQFSSEMQWFFVFMGFLLVALAGFIIVRSRVDQATIADEYAIIEDIIESEADLVRKSQKILVE